MMVASLRPLAAYSFVSYALAHGIPQRTLTAEGPDPQGWTPRPTDGPELELLKRQFIAGQAGTVLVAPDEYCGFVDGRSSSGYSCVNDNYACVLFPVTDPASYGGVACCTYGKPCTLQTACVGSLDYFATTGATSSCDSACRLDTYTLKCTQSSRPYCGGVRFETPKVQDHWCESTPVLEWATAFTTWNGEPNTRHFSTVNREDLFSTTTTSPTSLPSSTDTITITVPPSSSVSPTNTGISNGGNNKKSPPVGAIVGGSLGGVALIAIIAAGAFVLYRRDRKKRNDLPPAPQFPYGGPSEMDGNRTGGPQDYPVGIAQHFNDKSHSLQEPYSPTLSQHQYQPVPTGVPIVQDHYYPDNHAMAPKSDNIDARHLSMASTTMSGSALGSFPPPGSDQASTSPHTRQHSSFNDGTSNRAQSPVYEIQGPDVRA